MAGAPLAADGTALSGPTLARNAIDVCRSRICRAIYWARAGAGRKRRNCSWRGDSISFQRHGIYPSVRATRRGERGLAFVLVGGDRFDARPEFLDSVVSLG